MTKESRIGLPRTEQLELTGQSGIEPSTSSGFKSGARTTALIISHAAASHD